MRCSNYIWVIKIFIASYSAAYIKGLTVNLTNPPAQSYWSLMHVCINQLRQRTVLFWYSLVLIIIWLACLIYCMDCTYTNTAHYFVSFQILRAGSLLGLDTPFNCNCRSMGIQIPWDVASRICVICDSKMSRHCFGPIQYQAVTLTDSEFLGNQIFVLSFFR